MREACCWLRLWTFSFWLFEIILQQKTLLYFTFEILLNIKNSELLIQGVQHEFSLSLFCSFHLSSSYRNNKFERNFWALRAIFVGFRLLQKFEMIIVIMTSSLKTQSFQLQELFAASTYTTWNIQFMFTEPW